MNAEALGRRAIEAMLRRMRVGGVTVVESGLARSYGKGEPHAMVEINSPRVWATSQVGWPIDSRPVTSCRT